MKEIINSQRQKPTDLQSLTNSSTCGSLMSAVGDAVHSSGSQASSVASVVGEDGSRAAWMSLWRMCQVTASGKKKVSDDVYSQWHDGPFAVI
jgi:hypothetical protein